MKKKKDVSKSSFSANKFLVVLLAIALLLIVYLWGKTQNLTLGSRLNITPFPTTIIPTTMPTVQPTTAVKYQYIPRVQPTSTPIPPPQRVPVVIDAHPWNSFTAYCDTQAISAINQAVQDQNYMNDQQSKCISSTMDNYNSCNSSCQSTYSACSYSCYSGSDPNCMTTCGNNSTSCTNSCGALEKSGLDACYALYPIGDKDHVYTPTLTNLLKQYCN